MQTVNFQCGHCGNLMAVTADLLGTQVRCPHCQQVVHAPATASPPPFEPEAAAPAGPPPSEAPFTFAPVEEKESIFAPADSMSEDVFGSPPPPPHRDLPPPPAFTELPGLAEQRNLSPPAPASTNPFTSLSPEGSPSSPTPLTPPPAADTSWSASRDHTAWPEPDSPGGQDMSHPDFDTPAPPRVTTRSSSGWYIIAFIVPLVSYSILVTILAIIFYVRQATQTHPLEVLPDLDGDNKGARRVGMVQRWSPDTALPDKLKVALGQPIRVGDLEVTPQRVERTHIRLRYPDGRKEEPQRDESLVLHLQLRNVSDDVAFKPTDPEFLRAWDERKRTGNMPYTFLEAGTRRFYGGPIQWHTARPPGRRAAWYVEGHNHDRELRPGETMSTLVCTDPDQKAVRQLAGYKGPMLWRVQVRRGFVSYKNRDISATAVIGVEFNSTDVQPSRG